MNIVPHKSGNNKIAEVVSEERIITNAEDGFQLMVDLSFQDFGKIVLYEKNITPDFFDLKNGMAGELLQKFSTYRMQLAIIGDFSKYTSKSLRDFIYESNQQRRIMFVKNLEDAIK